MRFEAADRRYRIVEGSMLLGLAALTVVVFATTPLDFAAARIFYRAGAADCWPWAHRLPWSVLYGAAPWITAGLILSGLVALAFGMKRGGGRLRRQAAFVLLSVVVGPGLVVNFVFKDHWGRPRPRDITEFAGTGPYVQAFVPCDEGGASFPCGHCSVGFLCGLGWWIWRGRRPARAWTSLALGVVAGFALGLGRMSAGGHFLSDVVWSALLALGVAHVLHEYVLRLPARERAAVEAGPAGARDGLLERLVPVAAAFGGVAVLLAVFVAPHGTSISTEIPLPSATRAFEFAAPEAHVELVLIDVGHEIRIEGETHGFGLPTSTLTTQVETIDTPPTVRFSIVQKGWFTDLDAAARIELPIETLSRVGVRVDRGNIRVIDRTRGGVRATGRPVLDLHTGYGRVITASR